MTQYAHVSVPQASARDRAKALADSRKYQEACKRLGDRERSGDMNKLLGELAEWARTRKVANRHLVEPRRVK